MSFPGIFQALWPAKEDHVLSKLTFWSWETFWLLRDFWWGTCRRGICRQGRDSSGLLVGDIPSTVAGFAEILVDIWSVILVHISSEVLVHIFSLCLFVQILAPGWWGVMEFYCRLWIENPSGCKLVLAAERGIIGIILFWLILPSWKEHMIRWKHQLQFITFKKENIFSPDSKLETLKRAKLSKKRKSCHLIWSNYNWAFSEDELPW